MGRKKVLGANEAPEVAESTPFCYYCDREFDDVKTLVHHQRTKHFCCGECGRTFGSVTSLRVHMLNSYKKSLKEVPHAMSGRENPDVVVHGMDGLPQDILEERIQKSKADADDKREEEKERSKGAPKVDPSSPASKSLPPTAMPSTSPEPQSGQKQAASPETGNRADLPLEPPTPSQKLEENVDAAVTSLPPALKLLVPELLEETPQCEGLPDALASLHSIAVQALASFGLLQPGSYGANKMDAALQAAVAAVKQPTKPSQAQPAMLDVPSAALGPTVSLPVGFAPVAAQPTTQPLRPLGDGLLSCTVPPDARWANGNVPWTWQTSFSCAEYHWPSTSTRLCARPPNDGMWLRSAAHAASLRCSGHGHGHASCGREADRRRADHATGWNRTANTAA
ncbi:unnamed protein product [Cladocopium goreaui]|uniref:C2H2-type domain-containing protein n=1 Tax=Cladocopium goreaui TaxID=2562237 RepID=A0A9P1BUE3_9DINO|nr:unnamed protein product [Cladocopium goreaui]